MPGIDHLVRTDFQVLDKRDELHEAMGWLTGNRARIPILTDHGAPVGIINDRALMRRRLDPRTKLENYMTFTKACPRTSDLADVVRRMVEFRASYLPVEEDGEPVGYVRALDLARELDGGRNAGALAVPVTPLQERHTIGDALHAFAKEYVDVLPVLDAQGRLRSVLERRALLVIEAQTGHARGRKDAGGEKVNMLEMPIEGFTDPAPPSVLAPDAAYESVLARLEGRGYALVQDGGGRLLGMITPETILHGAPL